MRLAEAVAFAALLCAIFTRPPALRAADTSGPEARDPFSAALVQRAEDDLARTRALVDDGTLPKAQLDSAEQKLADVRDQATLMETLYGQTRLQDMTEEQASAMLAAAQRRVDREAVLVSERRKLLDAGVVSRSEEAAFEDELESRRRVLHLAESRAKLLDDLREMTAAEQRFERAAQDASDAGKMMLRYDGSGEFQLKELPVIANDFEERFHRALPVSAIGETALHRSMGLDHRNRVDIALNPDSAEGQWLRHLLENLRIPYLAFRTAIAGAATAPHIHIGPGSTRLVLAHR